MWPDERPHLQFAPQWDTPTFWAKRERERKLQEARARFAPRRSDRTRKKKLAARSRAKNRSRS